MKLNVICLLKVFVLILSLNSSLCDHTAEIYADVDAMISADVDISGCEPVCDICDSETEECICVSVDVTVAPPPPCAVIPSIVSVCYTSYVTLEPELVPCSLKLTKYVPISGGQVTYTDVHTKYVTGPARLEQISVQVTQFCVPDAIEKTIEMDYTYYATIAPQTVQHTLTFTKCITSPPEKKVIVEKFTVSVPGEPISEEFQVDLPHHRIIPPVRSSYTIHLTEFVTAAPQVMIHNEQFTYFVAQNVESEMVHLTHTVCSVPEPIRETYSLVYTTYVQKPATKKEGIVVLTEFITRAPVLKFYTKTFTFYSQPPFDRKSYSVPLTSYVTFAPEVQTEVDEYTIYVTPMPEIKEYRRIFTYYVTVEPTVTSYCIDVSEFVTSQAKLVKAVDFATRFVTGATVSVQVTETFTAYGIATPILQTEVTSYSCLCPSPEKVQEVKPLVTYQMTQPPETMVHQEEFSVYGTSAPILVTYTRVHTCSCDPGVVPEDISQYFTDCVYRPYKKVCDKLLLTAYVPKCESPEEKSCF